MIAEDSGSAGVLTALSCCPGAVGSVGGETSTAVASSADEGRIPASRSGIGDGDGDNDEATRDHSDEVVRAAPAVWKRTFTLREAALLTVREPGARLTDLHGLRHTVADEDLDVADPIGRAPEVFDATGAQISDAIDLVVDLLGR